MPDIWQPFFRPGGTLDPTAPCYIVRAADDALFEALERGDYVYLLDSRQKGKSSLVARTILRLRDTETTTVKLDLQRIGANVAPEQWYAGLVAGIGQELECTTEVFEYWATHQALGPLARWVGALEEVVLPRVSDNLVVFIDEVDFVRALSFSTDEFFAAIRDCCNRRASSAAFSKLTFCLVGVATPGQLIRNAEITPFNIGTRIELDDFTEDELARYGTVLDAPGRSGKALIRRLYYWLNGHPYLTQLVCGHLIQRPEIRTAEQVDALIREVFFSPEARHQESNFADVERRLLQPDIPGLTSDEGRTQVLVLYGRLLKGRSVEAGEENPVIATLRLSGVAVELRGALRIRNRLYAEVFNERWRSQSLPDAEVRRQKSAYRRATLRTAAVAGVVVLAVSAAAIGMLRLSNDRQRALSDLQARTGVLKRVSDEREDALNDLKRRTDEISKISKERQAALVRVAETNRDLEKVSNERQKALANLKARSLELSRQYYREQVSVINAEILLNRWTRVSAAVERSALSPFRQWEWGYAARAVNYGGPTWKLPLWSVFEDRKAGVPFVATTSQLLDLSRDPAVEVLRFDQSMRFIPRFRKGDLRVQMVESIRGDVIRDATDQRLLTQPRRYSIIMDVDPVRRLYLLCRDETSETVELRTVDSDRLVKAYKAPVHTDAARFLPDGTILSVHGAPDGAAEVRHWNRQGLTLDTAASEQTNAHDLALSDDGSMYAAWGYDEKVEVRLVAGHKKVSTLAAHPKKVTALEFSSDGSEVLTGCDDGIVRVFDTATGRLTQRLLGHEYPIEYVAHIEPKVGWMSIDAEGVVRRWYRSDPPSIEEFRDHSKFVVSATLDEAASHLVSISMDGSVVSRDLHTGKVVKRTIDLPTDPEASPRMTLSNRERSIFVGGAKGRLDKLAIDSLKRQGSIKLFDSELSLLQSVDGGARLFAADSGRRYAFVDAHTLKVVARIEPRLLKPQVDGAGVQASPCFAFDGETPQMAMYLRELGEVRVYSTADGSLKHRWSTNRTVLAMCFTSGGKRLVASLGSGWWVRDGQTIVFDVARGSPVAEFEHRGRTLIGLVYAPKTHVLAATSGDRNETSRVGMLWNMDTMTKIGDLVTGDAIWQLSFSPDGERLVSNSMDDGTIRIWNSRTAEECLTLRWTGSPSTGWSARGRFSDDGRRIIQLSTGGLVRLFNSEPWK